MRGGTLNRSQAQWRFWRTGRCGLGCRGGRPANSRALDVLEFGTLDDAPYRMLLRQSILDVMKAWIRVSAAEEESDDMRGCLETEEQ